MGICESCTKDYDKIPDDAARIEEAELNEFHNTDSANMANEFEQSWGIFQGIMLDQKFTSSRTFDKKFIWINAESRTLHMSQFATKERRHKEASLADIVSVDTNPPAKFKKNDDREPDITEDLYLTVHFVRGGGIDLRFEDVDERDKTFTVLTKFIEQNNAAAILPQ